VLNNTKKRSDFFALVLDRFISISKKFFKDIRTHIDKLIAKVHEAEQTQATQCHYCKETSKLEVFTKNKEEVKVCEDCYFGSECELK